MQIKAITSFLDELFPIAYQEEYDNSGLQIGDPENEIDKALTCVDVTEIVLDEAITEGCGLVISHHPLIFAGIKRLTGQTATERIVQKAIGNNIAIYSAHTNLDNHFQGLNHVLAGKLNLENIRILRAKYGLLRKIVTFCPADHADQVRTAMFDAGAGKIGNYDCCSYNTFGEGTFRASEDANPFVGEKNELHFEKEIRIEAIYPAFLEQKIIAAMIKAHPYEEVAYDILLLGNENKYVGSGVAGELHKPLNAATLLAKVKDICGIPFIKFNGDPDKQVSKIALCGGAGSFLINDAMRAGADIYLTGDLKYHDYFVADEKMIVADIGHYESEQFSKDLIQQVLVKKFPNFAVLKTKHNTNPVKYL